MKQDFSDKNDPKSLAYFGITKRHLSLNYLEIVYFIVVMFFRFLRDRKRAQKRYGISDIARNRTGWIAKILKLSQRDEFLPRVNFVVDIRNYLRIDKNFAV